VRPSAGSATFDGRRYEELDRPSTRVGAVLEDAAFHPGRTARNHLRVLATAGGHPPDRIDAVLAAVGLEDAADRRVKGYSMGMRQRLAIASALLGGPDVLVLDEPTNGLDPPGIRWIRRLLREQAAAGRAVLVSSHLLAEVAQSVDDVVVIADGEFRGQGPSTTCSAGATGRPRRYARCTPSGSPPRSSAAATGSSATGTACSWWGLPRSRSARWPPKGGRSSSGWRPASGRSRRRSSR
jgi:ABC-2 type transport system ATP-binding protein